MRNEIRYSKTLNCNAFNFIKVTSGEMMTARVWTLWNNEITENFISSKRKALNKSLANKY